MKCRIDFLRCLIVTALVLVMIPWPAINGIASQKETPQAAWQEHNLSFKGKPENSEGLEYIGPNAKKCVRFEPEGLRITLPADHFPERPTGLATGLAVRGDFEITMNYEILKEPERVDAGKIGTRLSLLVGWEKPGQSVVKITRTILENQGSRYLAVWEFQNPNKKNWAPNTKPFPTTAKAGRLRLARKSGEVFYYVADNADEDFKLLHQISFGKEDLDNVRIVGTVGSPKAVLDFRVTDLRIRSDSLPKVPEEVLLNQSRPIPPGFVPKEKESKGWVAAGLIIGMILTLSIAFGVWLLMRHRRRPAKLSEPGEENKGTPS